MKISAVGVTTSNLQATIDFYTLLGFTFPEHQSNEQHLEPITPHGSARPMIDSKQMITDILGQTPTTANHSSFAIEYNSPEELKQHNQTIIKEPWDAFWGQRYAIVADPDGYMIDLYAPLTQI